MRAVYKSGYYPHYNCAQTELNSGISEYALHGVQSYMQIMKMGFTYFNNEIMVRQITCYFRKHKQAGVELCLGYTLIFRFFFNL